MPNSHAFADSGVPLSALRAPSPGGTREKQLMPIWLFYGGTFDPVHNGHLAIARAARERLDCPVHLMPAADPPHRPAPGASADDRVRMLELAIAGEPGFSVDRRELDRSGPSYTVDTLRQLRRKIGSRSSLALLIGADSFLSLPQWQEWQVLLEIAHLVVAERLGSGLDAALPDQLAAAVAGRWATHPGELQQIPAGRVLRLRQPLFPISASEIRQRLAERTQWDELLPPAVAEYIRQRGLYQH